MMITSISINGKKMQTAPISGSNSKGYYTVWPDGSCEQYGEITAPTLTRLVGTRVNAYFPLEMDNTNYVCKHISQRHDAGDTGYIRQTWCVKNTTYVGIDIYNANQFYNKDGVAGSIFQWSIFGKVKESVRKELFGE